MIVCNFFKFIDELLSSPRPCSDCDTYPVHLSESVFDNYVECISIIGQQNRNKYYIEVNKSGFKVPYVAFNYFHLQDYFEEIEKNGQKLCYSYIVLGRRFGSGYVYSCIHRSFYVRCIAFEHCGFSLVIMTTIPRKK